MALILETGEGLANAESIVTLAEVRAFASSRGKSVSADDAVLEAQVRNAHDFLASLEPRLLGIRRTEGQSLPYPRSGLVVYGYLVAEGMLPTDAKNAICQLVIEQLTTPDLMPSTVDGRVVQQEVVGPVSTTYKVDGVSTQPGFPRVMAYLQPLLKSGFGMQTVRV